VSTSLYIVRNLQLPTSQANAILNQLVDFTGSSNIEFNKP
jgi:hypothetical protein